MGRAVRRILDYLFSPASRLWRWTLGAALVVVLLGTAAALTAARPQPALPAAHAVAAPRKPAPAPAALQAEITALAAGYGEPVGIAVSDVEAGWTAQALGDVDFPQQSVSKLWIALTLLDQVDHGAYRLEDPVVMRIEDLSVFYQPIFARYGPDGYATTFDDLLARALVESDNAAADRLVRQVGGAGAIQATLGRKGLTGIRAGGEERELQARISGMVWRPEYGLNNAFKTARAQLPAAVRDAAMDAYLAEPPDRATPAGVVRALAALQRGELLSASSTGRMIALMTRATTGPRRLKGGLPPGWTLAHKTGTGQDWRGAAVGINDVGLITAPDGRAYAVAVMIRRTRQPVPARLMFMQAVSAAVVRHWSVERGLPPPPEVPPY
ncbi:serine hydrolase [Phenylobacterium sp.]|jgi:beta-lactamase class A|uniref:serine hydrolase n=1 Tax=Phenylobacterium sp. TaxID=1871053 RepID=UPI002F3E9F7D